MLNFYTPGPIVYLFLFLPRLIKGMPKVQKENAASRNRTHDLLN
jgi:hypothetical protein